MKLNNCILALALGLGISNAAAEVLPAPQTTGGITLMDAMAQRKSSRDYDYSLSVTKQDISNICWAAWGITHDGKHTVGTAMNRQELEIYVITQDEVARYNPQAGTLTTIARGDFREAAGRQEFAQKAPLNIALVVDTTKQDKPEFQAYAAGAASQNIYLYCAQAGLKTVVRAMLDNEQLAKVLQLDATKRILYVQTVGQ